MSTTTTETVATEKVASYHPNYVKSFYVKDYFKKLNLRTSGTFVEAFDKHVESLLAKLAATPLKDRKTLTPQDIIDVLTHGSVPCCQEA